MPNYTKLAALASRRLTASGETVTFVAVSDTPDDPNKPWRGPQNSETTENAVAVEKTFDERSINGETIRFGDKRYVVAANDLSMDPQTVDAIRDGGTQWSVVNTTIAKPGSTALVYEFHVRQGQGAALEAAR